MSKSDAFESELLELIFNGVAIAGIAQNHSAPLASLYFSLHTADPGEKGSQITNECAYGSYARQAVARGAFTVFEDTTDPNNSVNTVRPNADVPFPVATSGSELATHYAIGRAASGAGAILYKGPLNPSISIGVGAQAPVVTAASGVSED